eukprot:10580748-Lingulodinium_polyedra.AAC.1
MPSLDHAFLQGQLRLPGPLKAFARRNSMKRWGPKDSLAAAELRQQMGRARWARAQLADGSQGPRGG